MPQQNGITERKNRTVVKMARSMLKAKGLPNEFWAEAVATAVYLLNLSPTRAIPNQIPYDVWRGVRPLVCHLQIFGCVAYALINSPNHSKLGEKSTKCIFVGYCDQSKVYRLYNVVSGKVIIKRTVVVNEYAKWNWQGTKDDTSPTATPNCIANPSSAETQNISSAPNTSPINSPNISTTNTPNTSLSKSPQTSSSTSSNSPLSDETPPQKF